MSARDVSSPLLMLLSRCLIRLFTRHAGRAVQVDEAAGGSPEVGIDEVGTTSIGEAEIGAAAAPSPAWRLRAFVKPEGQG